MSCDEELAERVRELAGGAEERRMFGGLAFLIGGNMAVAASGQGGLLVRIDPADFDTLIGDGVEPMVMRGREMTGWLRVTSHVVADDSALRQWVRRGIRFAGSLPAKSGGTMS